MEEGDVVGSIKGKSTRLRRKFPRVAFKTEPPNVRRDAPSTSHLLWRRRQKGKKTTGEEGKNTDSSGAN